MAFDRGGRGGGRGGNFRGGPGGGRGGARGGARGGKFDVFMMSDRMVVFGPRSFHAADVPVGDIELCRGVHCSRQRSVVAIHSPHQPINPSTVTRSHC